MADVGTIQTEVDRAEGYYTQLLDADTANLQAGCAPLNRGTIKYLYRYIMALTWDLTAAVNDSITQANYTILLELISPYNGGILPVNPNVIIPGQGVVLVPSVSGYNSNKIPFSTTIGSPALVLANYNTVYKQLYGNNPVLAIYNNDGQYVGDEQTPPQITYLNNDPNQDILSILWDYPGPTSGYIQISGIGNTSSSAGSSGGVSVLTLIYSQADLLTDGNGSYYLPLMLPVGKEPYFTSVNGASISITYDQTFTPARLYGFASGDAQTIIVKAI